MIKQTLNLLAALSLPWLATPQPASAAEPVSVHGAWAVFVEARPAPKICWTATAIPSQFSGTKDAVLSITKEQGKRPYVTLCSGTSRFDRSASLRLSIAGRRHSFAGFDGQNFFTSTKNRDPLVISQLRDAAGSQQDVFISEKRRGQVSIKLDGFTASLDQILAECS